MAGSGKIIIVLVFVCGLLFGVVLTSALSPWLVHSSVKQAVFSKNAPEPLGSYSQAVVSGNLVFLSGQIGIDPATGNISPSVEVQTARSMENLRAVLNGSGLGFGDVVQTRIYLTDMSDWTTVNGIYASYFGNTPPARAAVQVAGLPRGARIEIEMIAEKR